MVSDTTANMFSYAQLNSLNGKARSFLGLPASSLVSAGFGVPGFFACALPNTGPVSHAFQFGVPANLRGLFGHTFELAPTMIMHGDIMPAMRINVEPQVADWPQISDTAYCSSIKAGKHGDLGQNLSSFNKTNSGRYNSHPIGLYLTKQRPPGRDRRKTESQGGTTPTS